MPAAMAQTDRIYLTVINQDFRGRYILPQDQSAGMDGRDHCKPRQKPVPYMIGILKPQNDQILICDHARPVFSSNDNDA
jgi:hypothetical protein